MRRSPLALYAPLLAVVLVQAIIMSVAPSVAPSDPFTVADGPVGQSRSSTAPTTGPGATDPSDVAPTDAAATPGHPGDDPVSVTPPGDTTTPIDPGTDPDPTAVPTASGDSDDTALTRTPDDLGSDPAGDTSHCTRDGRQHEIVFQAPPCAPTWPDGADNGGATSLGVTADTITVLLFRENKNEQVTALLNQLDLRATRAQDEGFMNVAEAYLNEHYEFHGRTVDLVLFDAHNCPESPPDVPACRAEARRAIAEHQPFAVFWPTAIYPTVFDEFARAGVIALGGWNFSNEYFAARRPYRYDVFMDGTRSADIVGEYYCKKLANSTASHAGRIIHPSFPAGGARDAQERKLGIVVMETPATLPNGERIRHLVAECDANEPVMITYQPDVERAQQQASAATRAMIDAKVTTVVCVCDPVTPIFATQSATQSNYFPELLSPGAYLLDYDKLGRLYDQQQMAHSFGPSHLPVFPEFRQTDAAKIARAMGNEGAGCRACNTNAAYYNLIGAMLQVGGPALTPQSVEQGLFAAGDRGGWEATGGNPHEVLQRFGPGDHTVLSDFKEAYWSATARSTMDGQSGAYVPMDGGRRYTAGQLPPGLSVPVPSR